MTKIKILNLYAGIGGTRKLWPDDLIEVTAIENKYEIAQIYEKLFPKDKVLMCDAHDYLIKHYSEFDFIWSSPPCPTHSRMRLLINNFDECIKKYPDMKLYEEILFLKHFFKGFFVIENVISYYDPLIKPFTIGNHYYWSNFPIENIKEPARKIIRLKTAESIKYKEEMFDINLDGFDISNELKEKVLNNCVDPETGLKIFNNCYNKKDWF